MIMSTTTTTTKLATSIALVAMMMMIILHQHLLPGAQCQVVVRSKCNATRNDQADVCMQRMFMIGDRNQSFRETLDSMRTYCRQVVELQNCIKKYARECLPELGRQVTSLLIYGARKGNRPYCSNEKGMVRFNEIARCGNHEMERKHACMDSFLEQLDRVSRTKRTVENRINFVCCYFTRFKECISSTFEIGNAKARCPRGELKTKLIEMIGSYADDALELICGGSGQGVNEAKCKEVEKISETPEKGANATAHSRGGRQVSLTGTGAERKKTAPKSLLPYFVSLFGDI